MIGTFHTTDPDNKKTDVQTFTYELVTSQEGRFRIVGNQLQVTSVLLFYSKLKFKKKKEDRILM